MKILIRNYLAGSYLLEQEPQSWDVIVILDTGLTATDFVERQAKRYLYLRFDDVVTSRHGKRMPTSDDVKAALEFAKRSENLLVCCRAGQSRSAAIAFLIAFESLGAEAAGEMLNPERHVPNDRIIELGATLVDNPALSATFHAWKSAHQHVRLADYVVDIEREIDELESRGARNRIIAS